jgi:hypothetical protein
LRNLAIVARAGKEFTFTGFEKDVQDRLIEGGIGGVAMRFPISVGEIELYAPALNPVAIYSNRSVAKIRSGLAVPNAKLDDLNLFRGGTDKRLSKISGEPARLQFEFANYGWKREERALSHFHRRAEQRIRFRGGHDCRLRRQRLSWQVEKRRSNDQAISIA